MTRSLGARQGSESTGQSQGRKGCTLGGTDQRRGARLTPALLLLATVLLAVACTDSPPRRRLYHRICCSAEDRDPAVRAAAERLRGALLSGNGTAQTNLTYDEEVDFGRHQVVLMSKGAVAQDVQVCGLAGAREEIAEVTEALARGLGRAPGEKRSGSRYDRIRAARSACAAAFNGVHGPRRNLRAPPAGRAGTCSSRRQAPPDRARTSGGRRSNRR